MNTKDASLLSCWPDGFSRYYSIANILKLVFADRNVSILDVGGDSRWMSQFLDDVDLQYDLNIVDTRKPDFKNKKPNVHYTQGDFFTLSKNDYGADAVINTDVLEHIPKELKTRFMKQCIDFSNSIVIFSAPQDGETITKAEKKIDSFYVTHTGKSQRWLKEHFEYGKPDAKLVAQTIIDAGIPFLELNTNNIENWFTSFALNIINSAVHPLEGMDELNRLYNTTIHHNGDFSETAYRKIFVVFKDEELFAKKSSEVAAFFAPHTDKKNDYLQAVYQTLIDNLAVAHMKAEKLKVTEKNLKQTQKAYVESVQAGERLKNELESIKASRAYRTLIYLRSLKQKLVS